MRRRTRGPGHVAAGLLLAAAVGCQPSPPAPDAAVQAVASLRKALAAALRAALAEGPQHAVEVCRLEAPAITARARSAGVVVGRTSDRLRNPANAPEDWMRPLLAEFRGRDPEPGASRSVDLGPRGTGYVEPIYVQPLCTTCHGSAVDPDLLRAIRAQYPEDRAVGYEVGEFRGLFWAVAAPGLGAGD